MFSISNTEEYVISAIVVIVVLAVMYIMYNRNKVIKLTPVTGPAGGVTPAGSNTAQSNGMIPGTKATVMPMLANVDSIVFIKSNPTSSNSSDPDWRSFSVGELKLYDDKGALIPASAFGLIAYGADVNSPNSIAHPASNAIDGDPNTYTMTGSSDNEAMGFNLKTPTNISKIEIINRVDCCQDRLNGVGMVVGVANGPVYRTILTGDMLQTFGPQ